MAETKIYISDDIDARLREQAMKRFGYGKGSISEAVEEAIAQWLMKEDRINGGLQTILNAAKSDTDVIAVIVFGSYARKELDYRDVDIAIFVREGAGSFEVLSRYTLMVNAAEDKTFDISILNSVPLGVKRRILNEGIVLYVREKEALYDYSIKVVRDWSEFEPRMNLMING